MITKTKTIDSISVEASGVLSLRETIIFSEDGVEVSRSFHRTSIGPGSDLTGQDPRVIAIANAIWTQDVVQAYLDMLANEAIS